MAPIAYERTVLLICGSRGDTAGGARVRLLLAPRRNQRRREIEQLYQMRRMVVVSKFVTCMRTQEMEGEEEDGGAGLELWSTD